MNHSAGQGQGWRETVEAKSVTREVYARAEKLLGSNLAETVRNDFITPRWVGNGDLFWYRRERPGGHEFVLVDAATGEKRPAFDHAAAATALQRDGQGEFAPYALPFEYFEYVDGGLSTIRFNAFGYDYSCAPARGACVKETPALQEAFDTSGPKLFPHALEKSPDAIAFSADGARGVFTRGGDLWLVDLDASSERLLVRGEDKDFGWGVHPDNRGNFAREHRAANALKPYGLRWAPDNKTVLLPMVDQRHVETYPLIESAPRDSGFRPDLYEIRIPLVGEEPARLAWHLVDVETGAVTRIALPYDDLLATQMDLNAVRDVFWADDASRLFMVVHGRGMKSAYLFEVDAASGRARVVIKENASPRADLNAAPYSAANVRVIKNGAEAIWWSQESGWGHLYRYDVASGKVLNAITSGNWLVRDIVRVDEDEGVLFFTASGREGGNPYYRYLYRVNLEGSGLTLLTPEEADHGLLPERRYLVTYDGSKPYEFMSPSGRYIVYNYSRVDSPPRSVIRDVRDQSVVSEVERADVEGLYAAGWRAPEEFSVLADDGETGLWGTIYKPSDFDPDRSYPVISAQHGSPLLSATPRNFYQAWVGRLPLSPASYAELGFIVVSVDARGTANRNRDFMHHAYGRLDEIGLGDHVHALTELAKERPYMDIERVGVTGFSYGGYVSIRAMLEYPDFFKVAIAGAPMADMHAMYNDFHWTAYHGEPVYADGRNLRGEKGEIPQNWRRLAASLEAGRLKGKLFIQLGEMDENVLPAQALQFIDALIAENRDFDMLYLPNRNHDFFTEGYVIRRSWDYMVSHLAGAEPPENYKLGEAQ